MTDICKGDIGYINPAATYLEPGDAEVSWSVVAGAPPPPGIHAASPAARAASVVSDTLTIWSPGRGVRRIPRADWRYGPRP